MMTLGTHLFCLQDDRPVDQSFQNNVEQNVQAKQDLITQSEDDISSVVRGQLD